MSEEKKDEEKCKEITHFDKPLHDIVTLVEFDFVNCYYYENNSKEYAYLKEIPVAHRREIDLLNSKKLFIGVTEVAGGIILRFLIGNEKPLYFKKVFIELPDHSSFPKEFYQKILG